MEKTPSQFELEVLGYVENDYENVHSIRSDIERDLGRPVSEAELFSVLWNLAHHGLADAFSFDASTNTYCKVAVTPSGQAGDIWFLANANGIAAYERHHA
jgi:hypothetical protein